MFDADSYLRVLAFWESNQAPGLYEQEFVPTDLARYNQRYRELNGGRLLGEYELSQDVTKNTDENEHFVALAGKTNLSGISVDDLSYLEGDDQSGGVDLDLTARPVFRGATKR